MSRSDAFEVCRHRRRENARRFRVSARLRAVRETNVRPDPSGQRSLTTVRAFSGMPSAALRGMRAARPSIGSGRGGGIYPGRSPVLATT